MIGADLKEGAIMFVLELCLLLCIQYFYSVTMLNNLPCVSIASVGGIPCLQGYCRLIVLHYRMADRLREMARRTLGILRGPTRR